MAPSEQYTDDRLDRLAGDIRDESASRREDTSELRTELRNESRKPREATDDRVESVRDTIRDLSKEHSKDCTMVLCCAVLVSLLLFFLGLLPDDADAAAQSGSRPTASKSVSTLLPTKEFVEVRVMAPIEVRTDQRLDNLDEKIEAGSARAAKGVRHLQRHVKSSFAKVEDEMSDKLTALFLINLLVAFGFGILPRKIGI